MLVREFVWGTDEEFGTEGWIPKWIKGANAGSGFTIAHDVMEHFPNDPGGFEGEMMAFGQMLCFRGPYHFGGGFRPGWANAASSDISMFWNNVLNGDQHCDPCPKKVRLDPYISKQIAQAIRLAVREMQQDEPFDSGFARNQRGIIKNTTDWIRYGYRKACDRLKKAGRRDYDAYDLFQTIANHRYVKDPFHMEQGDILRIRMSLAQKTVSIVHVPIYEQY